MTFYSRDVIMLGVKFSGKMRFREAFDVFIIMPCLINRLAG